MKLRPANPKKCTLVLQPPSGEFISLLGEIRFPFVPGLPENMFKFSITTWMLALIIAPNDIIELQLIDYWNAKLPLDRIADLSRFLSWTSGSLSITVTAENLPPLSFEVMSSSAENTDIFSEFASVATMLLQIQSRSGSASGNISLTDLANSWKELKSFFLVLFADDMQLRILPISPWKGGIEYSYVAGYFYFEISGTTFMVVFDATVTVEDKQECGAVLTFGKRILRECFVGSNGEDVRAAGRECYVAKEFAYGDNYMSLGNIRDIFENR